MGYFRVLAAAAFAFSSSMSSAFAQCRVCDEVISLNSEYASCFAQIFDSKLSESVASKNGRVKIDLAQCGDGALDQERTGLLVMPSLTGQSPPPKSVYILDAIYLQCLHHLLENYEDPLDPQAQFDLFEQCQ